MAVCILLRVVKRRKRARNHELADLWGDHASPFLEFEAHTCAVLELRRLVEVLSAEVADVGRAGYLKELEVSTAKAILKPEVCDGKVPDTPQAPPSAYAYRSGRVRVDSQGNGQTQVLTHCLKPEPFTGCLAQSG